MRRRWLLRGALGVVLAGCGAATATTAVARTYSSPGYHWDGTLPKVAPTIPGKLVKLGDGDDPKVLVDAAGTAQIAYTTKPDPGPSVLHDCVLQRGQTSCAANPGLVPPTVQAQYSDDNDGPVPLALNNQLLMLDYRYPDGQTLPDGTSGYPTFLWTSDDGGHAFSGPGIVGHIGVSGNAVAFGASQPRIAWITDTVTGGTFFESAAAGAYQAGTLNLGDQGPDEAYNGRLAADGSRVVAEFTDLTDHVYVREWNGTGDIMQSASWSTARVPGRGYARIVSGPSGVFLLYETVGSENLVVQRVVDGRPSGAPSVVVRGHDYDHGNYDITEDAGGRLTVGWFNAGDVDTLQISTSGDGGRRWSDPQPIARHLSEPAHLQLGAAQDGGGFAAFSVPEPGGVSRRQIEVAAFGSFSATGLPGLGNRDGTGAGGLGGDPLASSSCTELDFGAVQALAQAGCFLRDPDNPTGGAAVSTGEIRLNGLQIIPDAGVKIAIDSRQHTINTTGSVSVVLRAPGIGDITLYHGELHVDLKGDLAGVGQTLFDFDVTKATSSLKGFPFSGTIDVKLKKDAIQIPASLKLPKYMGGVSANALLEANNRVGLVVKSLHIGVDELPLGALEISKLAIDYADLGRVWKGGAHINIPAGTPDFGVDVNVEFDDGDFTMGSFHADTPFPGIPIFEDAYLSGFGGEFDIHPGRKHFEGSVDIGAQPLDKPNYAIGVTGKVGVTFPDDGPVVVAVDGTGAVHGKQILQAHALFRTDGYFAVTGNADIDLAVVDLHGAIKAFADLPSRTFSSELTGSLNIAGTKNPDGTVSGGVDLSGVDGIVSSKGTGACGTYLGLTAGFGYLWGGDAHVYWHGCDFGRYRVAPPAGAPTASARGTAPAARPRAAVQVAARTAVTDLEVHGSGGAPTVVLTDPAGHTVVPPALSPSTARADAFQVADPAHAVTYVAIVSPRSGDWRVSAAPGSAPITTTLSARGYAPPRVRGSVAGRGHARTLRYRVSAPPGATVQFLERGPRSARIVGAARGRSGTLRFSPAVGPAGRREIVAVVSENGVPARRIVVAHYRAPGPARPGRVSTVRVARRGRAFRISFGRASGAVRYLVRAVAADGHRYAWTIAAGPHHRSVPTLGYADRVSVRVTGISATNRTGPTTTATASYTSPVLARAHRHRPTRRRRHR